MKKFVKHGIAIIGIVVLVFLAVGSAASGPSTKDKDESAIMLQKGRESNKNKNYEQAIAEFTEAIRLDPNNPSGYLGRGEAYSAINDYDRTIADYDKAIQQIAADNYYAKQLNVISNVYNSRGVAYMNKRDYDSAIADFDKAIQSDQNNSYPYGNRARIYAYYLKRDFNRAISDANRAINLEPNNALFLDTRGWAYLGNGDYDKAIADFEKALEINSNRTSSKEGLAQARLARIKPEPVKDEDFDIKQNTDNTITITNYKGTSRNVIIPDTLYGLKVTIIGNRAFRDKELISVVIPDTVITIEDGAYSSGAFSSNKELIKVTLGKSIKTIGNSAFIGCSLTEIIIPDSVTKIGDSSFLQAGLIKVTFGKGLQTIGSSAFRENEIVELNLPSSLKEIGTAAFYNNKIQKITFGTGLQEIGSVAFRYNQFTELNNLPSSLKTIRGGAFADNQIQSLTIPNGVTAISASLAFDAPGYSNVNYNLGAFVNNPITTVIIPASFANVNISGAFSSFRYEQIASIITTPTRITIPAGMKEDTIKGLFEDAFVNFWISQNRAGGTYVKRGPIWAKE